MTDRIFPYFHRSSVNAPQRLKVMNMFKMLFLVRRLPHLSREDFQRYWQDQHGPMVVERAKTMGIHRYLQRHTVSLPAFSRMADQRGGLAPFDGIAELWWETRPGLSVTEQQAAARAGLELLEDGKTFIDMAASPVLFVDDVEVVP